MNWDQIEGKWKQYSGKVKATWGKLTDDDLTTIKGKRDELVGRLQQRYGIAKDQAERQIDEFMYSLNDSTAAGDPSRARGAGH
ncbi:MAG TPA: CsbD family protein [Candidatus Eremiobacteraceae bacterium]|nr:CsbD family protein [Candidatus Eremiobacteraceae bacterium]